MATAVSICSNALVMLGDKPINDFSESQGAGGLDRARIASNLWPTVRDSVLRSHPWNCAMKRTILSPLVDAPAFEWSHQFLLPSDWLRNHQINGLHVDEVDYVTEGGRLLMNQSSCYLRYVFRNTNIETWDPILVDACELYMAARMAKPVTGSDTDGERLMRLFENKVRLARTVDGQDDSPQQLGSFEILNARRGYR
ncbi:MAG: hypothetical protein KKF24_01200 [Gammaproteobacteria bacterium]|nr:hypothetical protein [Gammaproteobacteria bacterium]MBU1831288.1 hypothetical protein [Gammaproteobacteria bacterium]